MFEIARDVFFLKSKAHIVFSSIEIIRLQLDWFQALTYGEENKPKSSIESLLV